MRGSLTALRLAAAWAMASTAATAEETRIFIATWRGCEEACQGFQDHLRAVSDDVVFLVRDAGQDKAALAGMRDEATSEEVDLIVTWGTTVTLGIAGTIEEAGDPRFSHGIPLVFMIVADPVASGIVEALDAPGRDNVTGTYNRMPESVTIETIRSYMPSFQRLGLLYNENEPNSVLKRDELEALSETAGFELIALPLELGHEGLPSPEDIAPRMRELSRAGADFVYVGSSSFLQANSPLLGAAAIDSKLPLLSPYEDMVRDGSALISVAARYYDVGRLAGQQAEAILFDGMTAGSLPVARMTDFAVTLNVSVARAIDLFPPMGLLQIAEIVE